MLEALYEPFLQRALLATLLVGTACSLVGVLVVTMRLSFIGVCMSHAAFAGALMGLLLGVEPWVLAVVASLAVAGMLGPLADRGNLAPDTAIGIVFSSALGFSFLMLSIIPGPKTQALGLLWGSVLTVTQGSIYGLLLVVVLCVGLIALFYKEIQTIIFDRDLAKALGIPAKAVFYGMLILSGLTTTASMSAIGGLLVFCLIINPAAAAYQLTYNLKTMFLLSAAFGVASCWVGLFLSWQFNLPTGALIVLTSCALFFIANTLSPKRRGIYNGWSKQKDESDRVLR